MVEKFQRKEEVKTSGAAAPPSTAGHHRTGTPIFILSVSLF
jgi:hypothetical protein